jgi:cholesterol transport system auxiliary component
MIPRRLFLIGASSVALAACGDLVGPPEAGTIYTVVPKFQAPAAGGAKVGWALAILRPTAGPGLDSDRIALTQPDGIMDFYAKATYPDQLPPLVQQALLEGFETTGRIDAVAREQDALHADYNLLIEIRDFAAHYAVADGVPAVTVAITAKLVTAHGRVIVGNLFVTKEGNASVNSAAAAAQALQQALQAAVTEIVTWALSFPPPASQQPLTTRSPGKPAEQLLRDTTRNSERARNPAP